MPITATHRLYGSPTSSAPLVSASYSVESVVVADPARIGRIRLMLTPSNSEAAPTSATHVASRHPMEAYRYRTR